MKKITLFIFALCAAGVAMAQNGTENGYDYVDLGLPSGLKWATCNVGAANPWDYGDYFAWGETVGYGKEDRSNAHNYAYTGNTSYVKTNYGWRTYKYCSGTNDYTLTKYCYDSDYGDNGYTDTKSVLDPEDDAAHVNMGGNWRMPTTEEQRELIENCYWEWIDNYNGKSVKGYIVYKVKDARDKGRKKYSGGATTTVGFYSLSDAHIFLPAAGYRYGSNLGDAGDGKYWSSSLGTDSPNFARSLYFRSNYVGRSSGYRLYGLFVRGVVNGVPSVYTITVTSNNAQYGTVSGGGTYAYNTNATLTATPNEGYEFVRWSDGNTQNPRTVTVTGNKTFTATFDAAYTITANSANTTMGTVSGGGEYNVNTTVTLTATPKSGYKFVQWNDGSTQNPRYVKVTGDATYTAEFAVGASQEESHGATVTQDGVAVTPFETKADFVWPSITGVASYSLIIWADEAQGKKVCTLTFNANGQLTNIDFTQSVKPQGSASEGGLNFTVTGLKPGITYAYTLDAKDAEDDVIETKHGTFTTMGADGITDITAAGITAAGINIYTEGRTIIVENATDAITVSDALGRVVGKDDAHIVPTETHKFPVPSSGVYVVKIGNRVASVLVR